MVVVAEGIEHRGQVPQVIAAGCRAGEGFLFSRPLDATAMCELMLSGVALAGAGEQ
jgi:EAL domain-containing protein (putative c-di-GMP-specific phosphodiesterase class I)